MGDEKQDQHTDDKNKSAAPAIPKEVVDVLLGLGRGVMELSKKVDALSTQKRVDDKSDDKVGRKDTQYVNLENLSRQDFLDLILDKIGTNLDEKIKAVDSKITDLGKSFSNKNITDEVAALAGKHPDFYDWGEEIKEIAQEHKGISIRRAYTLAKAENPEKVKELEEKYKSDEQKTKEKEEAENKDKSGQDSLQAFSLFPSRVGKTEQKKDMSKDEAAELAWQEVFGGQQ